MRRLMRAMLGAAAAVLGLAPTVAGAMTIGGMAEVLDSDLLLVHGYRIYLVGVESIEATQTCAIGGQQWDCYPAAVRALQTIVGQGPLSCDVLSGPNFLKQATARCSIAGNDVGEAYVQTGFGLALPAESADYGAAQQSAKDAKLGLWQGDFYLPADWRAQTGAFADRPSFKPAAPAN